MKCHVSKIVIREVSIDSNRTVRTMPVCMCSNKAASAEVTLADIQRLSKHLNLSMESVYDTYCAPVFDGEAYAPLLVTLKPVDEQGTCPFASDGACTVGEAKPAACRMAPLMRSFVPVRSAAWRVAYYVSDTATTGTQTDTVAHLLMMADAAGSECAFGHLRLAFHEARKQCVQLVELTDEVVEPHFMANAVRRMMTNWDENKSLTENAEQNRHTFRKTIWGQTEPRIMERLHMR